MATTAQENQILMDSDRLYYPVKTDGTADINQGDLVYFDTSAFVAKSLSNSDSNAATFAGVAAQSSFLQVYNTKTYPTAGIIVATRGIYKFSTTSGDTLHHGDACYSGADAQTVTLVAGTKKIGYIWMRASAGASLTGGAGGTAPTIEVLITPLWPVTGGL